MDFREEDDRFHGHTVFHFVCASGSTEIVQLLIKEFDNYGDTNGLLEGVDEDFAWSDISDSDDEELTKLEIKQHDSHDIHFLPCRFDFPSTQYCH